MNPTPEPDRSTPTHSHGGSGPEAIRTLRRNEIGQLVLEFVGRNEPVVDVRVVRCFPWSLPQAWIALRDADGHELLLVETLEELTDEHRALIEEELRDKVFNPCITRILSHVSEFGVMTIEADTDRGRVEFQIASRDDVRMLSPTQALFRDADGNTYELPDIRKLDPQSQKFLHEYF